VNDQFWAFSVGVCAGAGGLVGWRFAVLVLWIVSEALKAVLWRFGEWWYGPASFEYFMRLRGITR
jgi:hypothetical protein